MGRGGARVGAGRKKSGTKMIRYTRSVRQEWVSILDSVLKTLRNDLKRRQ